MKNEYTLICKDEEVDRKEFDFAFKKLRMKKKENKVVEELLKETETDPIARANKIIRIQEETKAKP